MCVVWGGGGSLCSLTGFIFHVMLLFNIYRLLLPSGISSLTSFWENPHTMMELSGKDTVPFHCSEL